MPQKGSSKYGDDVIVGSPEYFKRWRLANGERNKLAKDKYLAKQRERWLAAKLSKDDNISFEQAQLEVQGRIATIKAVEKVLLEEGRIVKGNAIDPIVRDAEPEIEFIKEYAVRFNIDYAVAFEIMDRETNPLRWEELMVEANHRKINAIKEEILRGSGEGGKGDQGL